MTHLIRTVKGAQIRSYTKAEIDALLSGGASPTFDPSVTITATDGPASLNLNAGGTTGNMDPRIRFLDDGVLRWMVRRDESTDLFQIRRHDSGGSFQDSPLVIDGATGDVTFSNDVTVEATDGEASLILDAGGTTGNMDGNIRWQDDGVNRWGLKYDESADELKLLRYNASGTFQDNPIKFDGSSGDVTVTDGAKFHSQIARTGAGYYTTWATTTIADDNVAYLEMSGSGSNGVIIVSGNLASSAGAMMGHFRFDNGLAIMSRSIMYFQDATSGYTAETGTIPTGTTYTDGRINLVQYDSGSTNRFYIENRSGASRAWTVTVISTNAWIESVSQGSIT